MANSRSKGPVSQGNSFNKGTDKPNYKLLRSVETPFFTENIDLIDVVSNEFVKQRGTKENRAGKISVFIGKNSSGEKITISPGKTVPQVWVINNAVKAATSTGGLYELFSYLHGVSGQSAWDLIREYAYQQNGHAYQALIENFIKEHGEKHVRPSILELIKRKPVQLQQVKREIIPTEEKVIKEFDFKPTENFQFLIDRGIDLETLTHPIFNGRFGSSNGQFATDDNEAKYIEKADLQYADNLIIPYWNIDGKVVSLEAKNKYTEEAFNRELDKTIRKGEKASDVRRNPSLFYLGSSKSTGLWISNIPEGADSIFVTEQPANALAYFQMNNLKGALEKTIFVSTGGSLPDGQLEHIEQLVEKHKIKNIYSGFDNDAPGLSYSVKLYNSFLEPGNDVVAGFGTIGKQYFYLNFGYAKDAPKKSGVGEITKLIETYFPGNNAISYYPLNSPDQFLRVYFPFNPLEIRNIHELLNEFNKEGKVKFHVDISSQSKDWNDQLQGKQNEIPQLYQSIFDRVDERKIVRIDENRNVFFQHRVFDNNKNIREHIATINPFAPFNPVKAIPGIIPTPEVKFLISTLRDEFNKTIPKINDEWFNKVLFNGSKYYPLQKEFVNEKGKLIAKIDDDGNLNFEKGVTSTDQQAVLTQFQLLENGYPADARLLEIYDYNKVRLNNQTNQGIVYSQEENEFQVIKNIGLVVDNKFSSKGKFSPEELNDIQALIAGTSNGEGKYLIRDNQVYQKDVWAKFINNNIEIINELEVPDRYYDVLERMNDRMKNGGDPNKTEQIGYITRDLKFLPYQGVVLDKLPLTLALQVKALKQGLEQADQKLNGFLTKYHEPLYQIRAKDKVLYYNNKETFKYDELQGLIPLLSKEEFSSRHFHPAFRKSLMLFVENKGILYNYLANVQIDKASKSIFLNDRDHTLGKFFTHEGATYYYLYNSLPEKLQREIEVFLPLPKAPEKILAELGIDLSQTVTVKEKVERWHSNIPAEYLKYYDQHFRFQSKDSEKLSGKEKLTYEAAVKWHFDNVNKKPEQVMNPDWKENGNVLEFKTLPFVEYDPESDKVKQRDIPFIPKFYPFIAAFELKMVKDPANRMYSDYLTNSAKPNVEVTHDQIKKLLNALDIEILGPDKTENIFASNGKNRVLEIGRILPSSGGIRIMEANSSFGEIAAGFKETIEYYASIRNKASSMFNEVNKDKIESGKESKKPLVKVEWYASPLEPLNSKIQEKTVEEIVVPNQNTPTFKHNLVLTADGVVPSLVESIIFKNSAFIKDNQVHFKFDRNDNGQLEVPLGTDYSKIEQKQFWKAGLLFKPKSLTVVQSPDQAILFAQNELNKAMINDTMYLSFINYSGEDQRITIDRLAKNNKVTQVNLIGDEAFIKKHQKSLNGVPLGNCITTITPEMTHSKLASERGLAYFQPDPSLQPLIEKCRGLNILNPAEGIALFPISDEVDNSSISVGKTIKCPRIPNGMFISTPLSGAKEVIITSNAKEAMAFYAFNKSYTDSRTAIITFPDKITKQHIERLNHELSAARFSNSVKVCNSFKLAETLKSNGFDMDNRAIVLPYQAENFFEEYSNQEKHLESLAKPLPLNLHGNMGKDKAPVIVQARKQEQGFVVNNSLPE